MYTYVVIQMEETGPGGFPNNPLVFTGSHEMITKKRNGNLQPAGTEMHPAFKHQ